MAGLLKRANSGFNGLLGRLVPNNNFGGLLTPDEAMQARRQGGMVAGASLLESAGPQQMPTSFGQALGRAVTGGAATRDQYGDQALARSMIPYRQAMMAAQIQAMQQPQETTDRTPAEAAMMQAIGLPMTKEGYAEFQKMKGDDSGLRSTLDALNLQMQGLQLGNMKREQDKEVEAERVARVQQEQGLKHGLEQTVKIYDLTKKLEGTALASGLPAAEWRRTGVSALSALRGAVGMDTDKLNADLTAFDEQKKNLADQLNNLAATGKLDQVTDAKMKQMQSSLADQNTQPSAIMEIQSVIAQSYLDQADAIGYKIPGREKFESAMEEMRNYQAPGTETIVDVPGAVRGVSDFATMSLEQLQSLDPAKLTRELREAAANRWDELNAR